MYWYSGKTILSSVYFIVCMLFIVLRRNIFYPKIRGTYAVLQGVGGILAGIIVLYLASK